MHTAIIEAMAVMDLSALTSPADARAALKEVIPNAETREFVLTNLVVDPATKKYKWKVNVAAIHRGLTSGGLTGFSAPSATPFAGPCLWIKGGKSKYIDPLAHSEVMHTHFPLCEMHTIDNSGHWPHHETPQAFLDILNPWFATKARKLP
mmetsp:Transcript_38462/g.56553  ORF Transcript_38462/g.56553 Transcript_38462/m.56553 type:complete len:150 (-) Transcript_38462:431-880(-)